MKRLTLICAVAAVIGVWPAASSAATFNGVVVAKQRGALLVATPAGVIRAVSGSAAIGSRVESSGGRVSVIGRKSLPRHPQSAARTSSRFRYASASMPRP